MDKLKRDTDGSSLNIVRDNIEKLKTLFPDIFAEGKIDFDKLRETLGHYVETQDGRMDAGGRATHGAVSGERYNFTWHGKAQARRIAQTPSTGTLRPCKAESKHWDTTHNLFIEGDNLEVLKLLQKSYHKRVKMIYIDPPYNTGKEFIYPDNYQDNLDTYLKYTGQKDAEGRKFGTNAETSGRYHTNWLNMMYPRLKLARNLLRDDGVIFISIGDNEVVNLRKLCDEILGEENFVSTIVWEKRYSPQNAVKWFSESHDFVIVYAKNKLNWYPNLLERSDEMNARYRNLDNDPRGVWKSVDSTAQGGHGTKSQFYVLTAPNGKQHTLPNGRCWLYTEPVLQQMIADNRIWFGADGNNVPAVKRFLSEVKQGTACQTIWKYVAVGHNQEAKKEVNDLFPESSVFDTPKPSRLIKRVLLIATDKNDIILDFFSGSATAAHAVMKLNAEDGGKRKFIMVQLPEACDEQSEAYKAGYLTIADIGKERIRRAGDKIKAEHADKESIGAGSCIASASAIPYGLNLDIGFKVFKLDSSNIKPWDAAFDNLEDTLLNAVDNIKDDRSEDDVLFEILLKYGLDLTVPIEERNISGKKVYAIGFGALVICLDDAITLDVVEGIGGLKEELAPEVMRVVFKDSGFADDVVKTNAIQILKKHGINDVKSL